MGHQQPPSAAPSTWTRPDVGRSRPEMQPIIVDLPALFGPSSPKIFPGSAVKLTRSTATTSPYCLRSAFTSIMNASPAGAAEAAQDLTSLGPTPLEFRSTHRREGLKRAREVVFHGRTIIGRQIVIGSGATLV